MSATLDIEQAAAMAEIRARWKDHAASCRPNVRFAPVLATPGEARAFETGYNDHPTYIGPDSASYRAGWALADKHAQIDADARGEDLWLARGGSGE